MFTAVSRGYHSPRTLPLPPCCGQCVQTWPQQRSPWATASPNPSLAQADFQESYWVWLPCGYTLLPRSCFLVPRTEVIEQWHPLYRTSGGVGQLKSQPKAAVRGRRGELG